MQTLTSDTPLGAILEPRPQSGCWSLWDGGSTGETFITESDAQVVWMGICVDNGHTNDYQVLYKGQLWFCGEDYGSDDSAFLAHLANDWEIVG